MRVGSWEITDLQKVFGKACTKSSLDNISWIRVPSRVEDPA